MRILSIIGIVLSTSLAIVLLSGKATVNFTHKPVLESLFTHKSYKVVSVSNGYNVYLNDTISSPNNYRGLLNLLFTADEGTTITMYLAGNGGNAAAMSQIVNAMRASRAHIICYVYGPVRSAHAVISINGDELKLAHPEINFLFHRIAFGREAILIDDYCDGIDPKKTDRGISSRLKCKVLLPAYERYVMIATMSRMTTVMTKDEFQRFNKGHDVLINGYELKKRLNKVYGI